jgi:hypothetical protein
MLNLTDRWARKASAAVTAAAITVSLVAGGCASSTSTAKSPLNLSPQYASNSPATTDPDVRVQCHCGTWAGSKGAPTQCKKILQQREHDREAAEAAASAAKTSQPATMPS